MSDSKFVWESATGAAEWDRIVAEAPAGTLFSETVYLNAVGRPTDLYYVKQGHEIKAAVCLVPTPDGRACELDDLVIYGGILFPVDSRRQAVKRRYEEFRLTEFIIERLDAQYAAVAMPLAPQFQDMRPFLWHHYHETDAGAKYALDLRYTSCIDLTSLRSVDVDPEQTDCFVRMETVRRYSVREARRKGGSARQGYDATAFIEFYQALMARQDEPQPDEKLQRMQRLIEALKHAGRAAIYEVLDKNGTVIYVTVYGWDKKRAYYLFGAGHPEVNEPWQGTVAHWEAFRDVAQRVQLPEVDLEGVNSPARGWFKLGFGGDLKPYYHVNKRSAVP